MCILGTNINQVNQILPHKNKWAWDLYLRGCANNWMPTEISMQKDIEQWKSNVLTPDERLLIKRCLGFFACSESLIGNNLLLTVFKWCNDGEIRQYLSRQMFEESTHALTVVYCCDSLNLDVNEIYDAYESVPTVKAKDDFLIEHTANIYKEHFDPTENSYDRWEFIKNLFIYYVLFEGLLFYNSFAALLSLKRRNLMPGLGQQIEYTLRDEQSHVDFGIQLINHLTSEDNSNFFKKEQHFEENTAKELLGEVILLEQSFVNEMIPHGLFGFSKDSCEIYIQYLANKRFRQLHWDAPFPKVYDNPFAWLSENIDLAKMKNFFESRVIDYKSGAMVDDF